MGQTQTRAKNSTAPIDLFAIKALATSRAERRDAIVPAPRDGFRAERAFNFEEFAELGSVEDASVVDLVRTGECRRLFAIE